jgi:hypothetical protein
MSAKSLTEWDFYFPSKTAAADATQGPFFELAGGVLFPEALDVAAKPKGSEGPYVKLHLVVDAGSVVCDSLEFKRAPGGAPIDTSLVRSISVSELVDQAVVWQSANARAIVDIEGGVRGPDGQYMFSRDEAHDTVNAALALRRQRSVNDELLREVAEVYHEDTTGAPTAAVEEHFHVSNRTATRWVKLARQRALIPPYQRPTKKGP